MLNTVFQSNISISGYPCMPCANPFMAAAPVVNPFMGGSIFNFGTPFVPFMPAVPAMPIFNFPMFNFPMLNFPFFGFRSNGAETQQNIPSSTSSKIKTGLLKGNLKGKEAYITSLCEKYGVDVGVVLSIIGQESGFGTSNLAKHNNFMGYRAAGDAGKNEKGYGYFSTPEKGLEAAIKNLANYPSKYKKQGVTKIDFNNIDAIGRIYCEGSSYSNSLRNIYNKTVKRYLA